MASRIVRDARPVATSRKTDLQTTVTGSIHHNGLTIERLHYQSRPGLYVAANLYLPQGEAPSLVGRRCCTCAVMAASWTPGDNLATRPLTSIMACGSRHGVACLTIDTVQLGELHGAHHGTYKLGRHRIGSAVDTRQPASKLGMPYVGSIYWRAGLASTDRALASPVVAVVVPTVGTPQRLDERIKIAVPVAGITDLHNHVIDGCVSGHCDCMYMINYYGWDYPKLAAAHRASTAAAGEF
ncbi:MAG: hypothetical protein R3C56_00145 [Pirellulaceae bacterium]